MKTLTYRIPNISCGGCVRTIKLEISGLPGIQSVDVALDTQRAVIGYDEPATRDQIEARLEEIGYPGLGG